MGVSQQGSTTKDNPNQYLKHNGARTTQTQRHLQASILVVAERDSTCSYIPHAACEAVLPSCDPPAPSIAINCTAVQKWTRHSTCATTPAVSHMSINTWPYCSPQHRTAHIAVGSVLDASHQTAPWVATTPNMVSFCCLPQPHLHRNPLAVPRRFPFCHLPHWSHCPLQRGPLAHPHTERRCPTLWLPRFPYPQRGRMRSHLQGASSRQPLGTLVTKLPVAQRSTIGTHTASWLCCCF